MKPGVASLALTTLVLLTGCSVTNTHRHQRFVHPEVRTVEAAGTFEHRPARAAAFDEALLSWDIRVSPGAAARLEARVEHDGVWSEWLTVGARGDRSVRFESPPDRDAAHARVDVDTVLCDPPADAIAWRVVAAGDGSVDLRGVWVTTTGVGRGGLATTEPALRPIDHAVPHKAQRDGGEDLGGRLCSPTAVAMVVASRGIDIGVRDMAERVYDADFDLYGNWLNNTQAASELGVPMRLTRIGSWAEAWSFVREGPMVISLPPFDERELTGAGYSSGSGHLIVITGFDGHGGVLVRDPAHAEAAQAVRVYRRDQLTRLWLLKNKGTAYVLDPRSIDG